MAALAQILYTSTRQLRRLMIICYGCSAREVLMKKRLDLACQLLRYSDSSVTEIAEQIGFHSEKYFSVCFRRHFDMTPSKYRRGRDC